MLLATGHGRGETATLVGVSGKTVWSWMTQCPEFRDSLATELGAIERVTRDRLAGTAEVAVEELRSLVRSAKHESVRLKAAMYILDKLSEGAVAVQVDDTELLDVALLKRAAAAINRSFGDDAGAYT
jgi:hypothetical protein